MPELIPTSVSLEGEEAQCVYERPSPTTPICMEEGIQLSACMTIVCVLLTMWGTSSS